MKTTKRTKIAKIVSLMTIIALLACTAAGCKSSKNATKNDKGQTVISVGLWPSDAGTDLDNMNARKARFEKANPDVEIKPDTWNFDRKTFYAKAAGGQLPTVYVAGFTELQEIINSKYAADLTDVLKKRGYLDKINSKVLEMLSKDGKIYALPRGNMGVLGFACNMDLMKQAGLVEADGTPMQPKDWNEVLEFAIKIKEKTGKPGLVLPTATNSGGWIFTQLAWSFGTHFMEKQSDGNWKATFNTPECESALQFVKDLKWKYNVIPENAIVTGDDWSQIFSTGGAGMSVFPGTFQAAWAKYGMKPEQIGMMAMPAGPKDNVTLISGELLYVNSNATEEQIDAAVRWISEEFNYEATDNFKKVLQDKIDVMREGNQIIGIKSVPIWKDGVEAREYENQLIDENVNVNPNNVKLYNDFIADCPAEMRAEEPVNCQQLYGILADCLQEVLVDEKADCKEVLEKANSDFQANYLDNK